ncbi:TauD/TfdA family dioxygenase [Rhodococcus opacus]|uniref:TauD/TfdA family dioxygenase n=1 Tax=Rhodococcus opacus TaxID=37919 RepID=UPI0006BB520A|nr:TauD/TfdA family dioxygenase [Rhodococcus opacus]
MSSPALSGTTFAPTRTIPAAFVRDAQLASGVLPPEVIGTILDFAMHGEGGLLLRELQVGPTPRTPESPHHATTRLTLMAAQSAALMSVLGHLVAYRPECLGQLVQTLVPTRKDRYRQTSTGSRVDLESHTEQCMNLLTRPVFIGLGCLRGDPHAATYLLSARELQRQLPNGVIRTLRETEFFTRVDPSFVDGGVPDEVRGPMAVLSGSWDDPAISYDEDLMFSPSMEHQAALESVRQVWRAHRHSVVLRPGDLLIVDNTRAVHGRSSFVPQWDGGDRWLCRVQVLLDFHATRFARQPGSPVIEVHGC